MNPRLSEQAAKALNLDPEEARKEREKAKREEAARQVRKQAKRQEERRRKQREHRARVEAERNVAHQADAALEAALDSLDKAEEASDPKRIERLQADEVKARHAYDKADEEVKRLENKLHDAKRKRAEAEEHHNEATSAVEEAIEFAKGDNGVEGAKAVVAEMFEKANEAWQRLGKGYRKKNRDRMLKNRAKEALGVKRARS